MSLKIYAYIAAALLLAGSYAGTYFKGRADGFASGQQKADAAVVAQARQQVEDMREELKRSRAMNDSLLDRLAVLPTSTTVREIVHANPSACVVPEPVARGLQDLARATDAARSAK